MRRLFPTVAEVPLDDVYAGVDPPVDGWVAAGMVTTVDGATAIDGVSGPLGGEGDRAAFRALRSLADVVVAGAATVAAEDYSPSWPVRHRDDRSRRGQAPRPRLAVVTGSGRVDARARVFADAEHPPLLVTTADGAVEARRRGVTAELVEVADDGTGGVSPADAVAALRSFGLRRVVLEGGPRLNAAWLSAGVVDELFVTIAGALVGTVGPGIAGVLAAPLSLTLLELRLHGSELVLRYRVEGHR